MYSSNSSQRTKREEPTKEDPPSRTDPPEEMAENNEQQRGPNPSELLWRKILKVHEFDGVKRSIEAVDEWIERIEDYRRNGRLHENARMEIARTQITGSAIIWWKSTLEEERPTTRNTFVERIRKQFYPENYKQALRDKVHRCKQFKTVAEYIDQFRAIIIQIPDVSKGDTIDKFIRGLKPRIAQRVRLHSFDTLDEVAFLADQIDRAMVPQPTVGSNVNCNVPVRTNRTVNNYIPMDVDNVETTDPTNRAIMRAQRMNFAESDMPDSEEEVEFINQIYEEAEEKFEAARQEFEEAKLMQTQVKQHRYKRNKRP